MTAQKIQRRYQWQAKHGEVVTIDPFEKLDAETFELIGADARGRGITDHIQIVVEKPIRESTHGKPCHADVLEQHRIIADKGNGRIKFMRLAG